MERYTVKFRDSNEEAELAFLIPLACTSTVAALLTEAKRRAVKRLPRLAEDDLIPHYGGERGPILDGDDILGDVISDAKNEIIFMTTHPIPPPDTAEGPSLVSRNIGLDPFCLRCAMASLADCRIVAVANKQRSCEIRQRRSEDPSDYSCFSQGARFDENHSTT